jgi:hypothetical protein
VVRPKSREFESAKWASGLGEDAQSFLSRLASSQTQGGSMQNVLQVDGHVFPSDRHWRWGELVVDEQTVEYDRLLNTYTLICACAYRSPI